MYYLDIVRIKYAYGIKKTRVYAFAYIFSSNSTHSPRDKFVRDYHRALSSLQEDTPVGRWILRNFVLRP